VRSEQEEEKLLLGPFHTGRKGVFKEGVGATGNESGKRMSKTHVPGRRLLVGEKIKRKLSGEECKIPLRVIHGCREGDSRSSRKVREGSSLDLNFFFCLENGELKGRDCRKPFGKRKGDE